MLGRAAVRRLELIADRVGNGKQRALSHAVGYPEQLGGFIRKAQVQCRDHAAEWRSDRRPGRRLVLDDGLVSGVAAAAGSEITPDGLLET